METKEGTKEVICPKCGSTERQRKNGHRTDGTQIYKCNSCNRYYTIAPPKRYTEEIKQQALRAYYSGMSGRAVGKMFGMSKANVYNWIKKNRGSVDKSEHEK